MGEGLGYSDHAKQRMVLRRVTDEEVRLTVNNPHYVRPGDFGATNYFREIGGRVVRVTVGERPFNGSKRVVITVAVQQR